MSALAIIGGCFATGFLGSLHCVGMCGPIVNGIRASMPASAVTIEGRSVHSNVFSLLRTKLWPYHVGRLLTYAALGLLGATLVQRIGLTVDDAVILRRVIWTLAAIMVGAVGIHFVFGPSLFRWRRKSSGCERWSASLASRLDFRSVTARFVVGGVLGLLPCGLVYGALALASSTADPMTGAASMFAFGLGTVPALVVAEGLLTRVPTRIRRWGVRAGGAWMVLLAAFALFEGWNPTSNDDPPVACPLCVALDAATADKAP